MVFFFYAISVIAQSKKTIIRAKAIDIAEKRSRAKRGITAAPAVIQFGTKASGTGPRSLDNTRSTGKHHSRRDCMPGTGICSAALSGKAGSNGSFSSSYGVLILTLDAKPLATTQNELFQILQQNRGDGIFVLGSQFGLDSNMCARFGYSGTVEVDSNTPIMVSQDPLYQADSNRLLLSFLGVMPKTRANLTFGEMGQCDTNTVRGSFSLAPYTTEGSRNPAYISYIPADDGTAGTLTLFMNVNNAATQQPGISVDFPNYSNTIMARSFELTQDVLFNDATAEFLGVPNGQKIAMGTYQMAPCNPPASHNVQGSGWIFINFSTVSQ